MRAWRVRGFVNKLTETISKGLQMKSKVGKPRITPNNILSTGSTLVNLCLTGKSQGGFIKGLYYCFVGASGGGKTWLALSCLAEACQSKRFDDYELIYDNTEDGALMDLGTYFGKGVAERLSAPNYDNDGLPVFSETVDEFYFNASDAFDRGPCIYILDSMDALSSESEGKKFKERKKASRAGKLSSVKGDYGDGKAKKNSSGLRILTNKIRKNGSILIVVCQSRDNIGMFSYEKETRSGGRAISFYATVELWTTPIKKLKKGYNKKDRVVGGMTKVHIKKNRLTGKTWTVEIPMYFSYGIDDIGSCVDWLIEEEHWPKPRAGAKIKAPEFDFTGTRNSLIKHIEKNNLEKELRKIVGSVWKGIETAIALDRKPRYE